MFGDAIEYMGAGKGDVFMFCIITLMFIIPFIYIVLIIAFQDRYVVT